MAEGWIKLHRKLLDCEIWLDDSEKFDRRSAWIDLLLLANHRDKKIIFDGKPMVVNRGQYVTSVRKLSTRWGWSTKKTLSFLKLLCELGMITKESDTKKTLLTLENYDVYQDTGNTEEHTEETQRKHRLPTNKNIKNVKNEKNKDIYGVYKHVSLTKEEFEALTKDFGEAVRDKAITYLDEYIEDKPRYKHNSDYLCIRRWVIDAVTEKAQKAPAKKKENSFNQMIHTDYDFDALEKQLLGD